MCLKARCCLSSLSNWQHRWQLSEVIRPTRLTYQPGPGQLTLESPSRTSSGKRPGWLTWPQHQCPERLNLGERNLTCRISLQPASSGHICSHPISQWSVRSCPSSALCPQGRLEESEIENLPAPSSEMKRNKELWRLKWKEKSHRKAEGAQVEQHRNWREGAGRWEWKNGAAELFQRCWEGLN